MKRVLMTISPSNLDALRAKGVESHILQRDLNGYWDRVLTVQPFSVQERVVVLNERHTVLEFPARGILRTMWRLPGIARKYEVTVVKAHDPFWMGLLALVVSVVCRIPYTVRIGGCFELMWKLQRRHYNGIIPSRLLDKVLGWIVLHFAAGVNGWTGDAMNWALRSGARKERASVARTGVVDALHFAPLETRHDLREELGLAGKKVVVAAGRLVPARTPLDVILAFHRILFGYPDSVLLLAGDGILKEGMQQMSRKLGIDDKVTFLGFQPQERLRDILYTADVILVPLGGSGMIEACLSSRPVVAYDVDWHSEIIMSGFSGLLVPHQDFEAMGIAAVRFLANLPFSRGAGRMARQKAIAQHNIAKVQNDEVAFFDEVVKRFHACRR